MKTIPLLLHGRYYIDGSQILYAVPVDGIPLTRVYLRCETGSYSIEVKEKPEEIFKSIEWYLDHHKGSE